ncbi:hypothetical protein PZA11_006276 [Diplocarpon coronariae]
MASVGYRSPSDVVLPRSGHPTRRRHRSSSLTAKYVKCRASFRSLECLLQEDSPEIYELPSKTEHGVDVELIKVLTLEMLDGPARL